MYYFGMGPGWESIEMYKIERCNERVLESELNVELGCRLVRRRTIPSKIKGPKGSVCCEIDLFILIGEKQSNGFPHAPNGRWRS
jgi:hypothetical protein